MPLGLDELIGALPDAIAWAIMQVIKTISGEVISQIIDYGFEPLLKVSNPVESDEAVAAWDDITEISIALLPIAIAGGLIVWPFSEEREASLWNMALRVVGVLFFIAISKPLWGFLIDATNAVTLALSPDAFKLTFAEDTLGFGGTMLGLFLYPAVAVMMFFSYLLSLLLLVLRWFLIWIVFIGSPLFGVLWYPNWGPMQPVSKYASTFLRMGVYALLAGPVIAIVLRVFSVIMTGGVITGQDGVAGTLHEMGVSIVLILLLPLVLFVVIYKVISWAGQPLGFGQAFTMAAAGIAAIAGATVALASGGTAAAAGGAGAAGAGGAGGAGGTGGTAGSAGGGAAAGKSGASAAATDPSAATDGTSIGSGLRQSLGDSLSTNRESSMAEQEADLPHERVGSWAKRKAARGRNRAGSILGDRPSGIAQGIGSALKTGSTKAGRAATGSDVVDYMRGKEQAAIQEGETHMDNMGFLNTARETGEIDIQEAEERGLLETPPAENVSTVPVEKTDVNGEPAYMAKYNAANGEQERFNVTEAHNTQTAKKQNADAQAKKWAQRTSDARTGGRAAKRGTKGGTKIGKKSTKFAMVSGKVGAATMLGAATGSPYFGYRVGQSMGGRSYTRGAKNMLIGPSADGSGETGVVEVAEAERVASETATRASRAPNHDDVFDQFG